MEFDPNYAAIRLSHGHCHQATCVSHYHSVFTQGSLVTSSTHYMQEIYKYITDVENNALLSIIVPLP